MNLEEKIQKAYNVADMLRNAPQGPYVYPMRAEYTNWRDEQRAWQETAVMFDQSHHMTDIYFKGPDALRLMSDLSVNGFKNFGRNKAKQFVACNYDGYFVGMPFCSPSRTTSSAWWAARSHPTGPPSTPSTETTGSR